MQVTAIKTFLVGNIPPYLGGRYFFFIKLCTDEGIEGLGEVSPARPGRETIQIEVVETLARHFVIGADPFQIERLWQNIYSRDHDFRHPSFETTAALSALEMACWDIVGKAVGQPIYNLLGGRYHHKLRAYAYMPGRGINLTPKKAGEIAAQLVANGHTATKFDPFRPLFPAPRDIPLQEIQRAEAIFASIRDAVGGDLEVAIGTHGQMSTASAIRIAKILEPYHPFWFEEPVAPENVSEMARVAAHTSIPIATGERLLTRYEFVELLQKQAAQIIQMDVGQCGGILESKKIAAMAEGHLALIAPHMYCGPIAAAAAIQVATCSPNFLIQEFNGTTLHSDLLLEPIVFENGYIVPPSGPGLGVELNEQVVATHPYNPNA